MSHTRKTITAAQNTRFAIQKS